MLIGALQELVKAKLKAGKSPARAEVPRALGSNVVDLMEQLRASVEGKGKKAPAKPKPSRSKKSA